VVALGVLAASFFSGGGFATGNGRVRTHVRPTLNVRTKVLVPRSLVGTPEVGPQDLPVITPDQAIQDAVQVDDQLSAGAVQAVLVMLVPDADGVITPGADPSQGVLAYDVQWTQDCIPEGGSALHPSSPGCAAHNTTWHTIINASNGAWMQSYTDN